jgi:hypothetical protein
LPVMQGAKPYLLKSQFFFVCKFIYPFTLVQKRI